jgi:hypothetical protein
MAITITATAGSASANSYATVSESETYHDGHPHASTWDAAATDTKNRALVNATLLLDTYFNWYGTISTSTQALRWPRLSVSDPDGRLLSTSTIPVLVRNATCELARKLIDNDRTADDSDGANGAITEMKVGSLEVKYASSTVMDVSVIPAHIVTMLKPLGILQSGLGGAITVRRA